MSKRTAGILKIRELKASSSTSSLRKTVGDAGSRISAARVCVPLPFAVSQHGLQAEHTPRVWWNNSGGLCHTLSACLRRFLFSWPSSILPRPAGTFQRKTQRRGVEEEQPTHVSGVAHVAKSRGEGFFRRKGLLWKEEEEEEEEGSCKRIRFQQQ